MNRCLITNAHLYTPGGHWQPGWLLTEGQTIRALGPGQPPPFEPGADLRSIDARGQAVIPGFIDLHVHGAMGHEAMDASPAGLHEMACFYARHGVTAFLATTWTASRRETQAVVDMVRQLKVGLEGGARVLGVHLEGPFLNPARCGAQDISLIRRAARDEALEYLDSGVVRLVALAPEFPENVWLLEECVRRGIRVSAGHTAATYAQVQAAVQLGLRQVTHCFNAMTGLAHREPGTVGAAMSLAEIQCELIADNIHVHPAVQKILVAAKGPLGVILITDAVRGAGLPDGEFALGDRTVFIRNGAAHLPDGTLAGSILTMDRALRNVMAASGLPLAEAWPMSSLNAARALGVSAAKGSLEVGKDADLVMLDQKMEAGLTMVEGQIVWEKGAESESVDA
jgi:N-acetylglucosamine-6-phosphate deacetylase